MYKPLNDAIYKAEFPVRIQEGSFIQGFIFRWNPCCPDRPVLIVGSRDEDGVKVRSIAQCACGLWHTPKFNSESAALREYEKMTATHEKIKYWEKKAAERTENIEALGIVEQSSDVVD